MNSYRRHNQKCFVTSEFLPYSKLIESAVVELLKKYRAGLCLCVREDQLNEELDRLCRIYEEAGIQLIFWPLLSPKEGLYLNKYSVKEYYNYLDIVFDWVESRRHRIFGLLVDVEPDYVKPKPGSVSPVLDNMWHYIREMDEEAFRSAISGFKKIIAKIRKHHCKAIGAALPFVCNDKLEKSRAWQDYWGGPVACVKWDMMVFMLYGSWFVEMGMNWPTAHFLIYDYTKVINKFWRRQAVVALGVTTPGTGAEKALYESPEQLATAVSAVRAAGVNNIAVYDLKGILASPDPELWFTKILSAPPLVPRTEKKLPGEDAHSRSGKVDPLKIMIYKIIVNIFGEALEVIRFIKSLGKRILNV